MSPFLINALYTIRRQAFIGGAGVPCAGFRSHAAVASPSSHHSSTPAFCHSHLRKPLRQPLLTQCHRSFASQTTALTPAALGPPSPAPTSAAASSTDSAAATKPRKGKDGGCVCPHCSVTFSSMRSYTVHAIEVHQVQPSPTHFCDTCPHCGRLFASRLRLEQHINSHTRSRRHSCPHCTAEYTFPQSLQKHMREAHSGEPRYACVECSGSEWQQFATWQQAQDHYAQQHQRTYRSAGGDATQKPKRSPRSLSAAVVRRDQQGVERHVCPACYQHFGGAEEAAMHMRYEHQLKPHHCQLCSGEFKTRSKLQTHLIEVHGQRPADPSVLCLECSVCGKLSGRRSHFEKHAATHLADRPFACSHCDKTFRSAFHCRQHLKDIHGVWRPPLRGIRRLAPVPAPATSTVEATAAAAGEVVQTGGTIQASHVCLSGRGLAAGMRCAQHEQRREDRDSKLQR